MKFTCAILFALIATALAVTKEQVERNPSRGEENWRHPEYTEGDILPGNDEASDYESSPSRFEENIGEDYLEGDILAPVGERSARNLLKNKAKRWPQNTVKYYIDRSVTDSTTKSNIQQGIAGLRKHFSGCLTFTQVSRGGRGVITIRPSNGCSATLGYYSGGMNMQLSKYCPPGTVMHEFLHSLGVHHEQTRSDRDRYVRIDFGNIKSGVEFNFKKGSTSTYDTMGFPYDFKSIMHYGAYAFSKNRAKTIVQLNGGNDIGQRKDLTSNDVARVKKMYGCSGSGSTGGGGSTKPEPEKKCKWVWTVKKWVWQNNKWVWIEKKWIWTCPK